LSETGRTLECRDGSAFLSRNHRFPGLELLPAEAHEPPPTRLPVGTYRTQGATGWTDGALDWPAGFIKLLVALVTKQLGAQVMDWLFAAVVWGASDEVRRMAAPQRMAPAPMLLVAMAE
jgi:hypothetical protein